MSLNDQLVDAITAVDGRLRTSEATLDRVADRVRTSQTDSVAQAGLPADLIAAEQNVFRRLSPARHRWPDLAKLDDRAHGLERRQGETSARIAEVGQALANAGRTDADALADWQLAGARGPRPEPSKPLLEAELEQLQGEHEGLTVAITRVLEDKYRFVERHRSRLVKEADKRTAELQQRYEQLVEQAAQAREELAEMRQAALWAAVYPDPSALTNPPDQVCGAHRAALERAGINNVVSASRVFELLAADAAWLADAATAEQRRAMGITEPAEATWTNTDEGVAADRKEKKEALTRYREMWGRDPV